MKKKRNSIEGENKYAIDNKFYSQKELKGKKRRSGTRPQKKCSIKL